MEIRIVFDRPHTPAEAAHAIKLIAREVQTTLTRPDDGNNISEGGILTEKPDDPQIEEITSVRWYLER